MNIILEKNVQQELNDIKGKLLLYITIFVIMVSVLKIVFGALFLDKYYVELFILSVSLVTYLLRITVFSNMSDEKNHFDEAKLLGGRTTKAMTKNHK